MQTVNNYLGIDIAAKTFTVSLYREDQGALPALEYPNTVAGFEQLACWFSQQRVLPENSVLCLEASGVYTEALCYYFHRHQYRLVVESPKKAKQAFQAEDKDDAIDAQQLGEYAYRYFDKLLFWEPKSQRVEQVNTLLGLREQFAKHLTAHKNELKALRSKVMQTPFALALLEQSIPELAGKIQQIEEELQRLLAQDPPAQHKLQALRTLPGVGLLLPLNLFAFTEGFQGALHAKKIAARLGIVPRKHQSGSSVYRKPKSRREGHTRLRKLLYLAAMSVKQHDPKFKKYYLRMAAQGKPGRLILNNIANKLLRIICAMLNANAPFIENYQSINPALLKKTA